MPPYAPEDLPGLLADTGIVWYVTANPDVTYMALEDMPDEALAIGRMRLESTMYEITVITTDAESAGLDDGLPVTVDGVAYTVRDVLKIDDGALSRVTLSAVS